MTDKQLAMNFIYKAQTAFTKSFKRKIKTSNVLCEACKQKLRSSQATILHHIDYNKPFFVAPLCRSCHSLWHKKYKVIPLSEINIQKIINIIKNHENNLANSDLLAIALGLNTKYQSNQYFILNRHISI